MMLRIAACLALSFSLTAQAQFDDEFDDEFGDAPAEPSNGFDDDGFGDGFEDEPEVDERASAEPDEAAAGEAADASAQEAEPEEAAGADTGAAEEDAGAREEAEEDEPDPREFPSDRHRFRLGNTFMGTTGGFHVPHALGAPAGTFRVQLAFEFFAKDGFLFEGDSHSRLGGALSLSWAVHKYVELYGALASYATSNTSDFPNLLIVLGDVELGAKVGVPLSDTFSLGGDFAFLLPTGTGLGPAFDGVGARLRANATVDLRGREDPLPFIARFSAAYTFDRSEELIAADEDRRFERLVDPAPREEETRHLITRAERNALSIDRTDFFEIGIGFEAPIEIGDDMQLSPIVEYNLAVPVNRQDYVCPFLPAEPGGSTPAPGEDGCLDEAGFSSFPQTLSFGARFLPPVRGLQTFLNLDVGLTGRGGSDSVRELTATAPWKIWLGIAYAHDARAPQVPDPILREVEVPVEVIPDPPPGGRILGRVLETDSGSPVPGARVRFIDPVRTAILGSDEGSFTTYRFEPGTVRMFIEADGHESTGCEGTIAEEGGDVQVECRVARNLVSVEEEEVVILEQIQFALDS
ncbi:MAG: hypothetical protein AAF645_14880, partial [Myxococcota bacterium]